MSIKTIDERIKELEAEIKRYPIRQELYIKRGQLLGDLRKNEKFHKSERIGLSRG